MQSVTPTSPNQSQLRFYKQNNPPRWKESGPVFDCQAGDANKVTCIPCDKNRILLKTGGRYSQIHTADLELKTAEILKSPHIGVAVKHDRQTGDKNQCFRKTTISTRRIGRCFGRVDRRQSSPCLLLQCDEGNTDFRW